MAPKVVLRYLVTAVFLNETVRSLYHHPRPARRVDQAASYLWAARSTALLSVLQSARLRTPPFDVVVACPRAAGRIRREPLRGGSSHSVHLVIEVVEVGRGAVVRGEPLGEIDHDLLLVARRLLDLDPAEITPPSPPPLAAAASPSSPSDESSSMATDAPEPPTTPAARQCPPAPPAWLARRDRALHPPVEQMRASAEKPKPSSTPSA